MIQNLSNSDLDENQTKKKSKQYYFAKYNTMLTV